jgi:NADH-quinone oxidoreductase subunit F
VIVTSEELLPPGDWDLTAYRKEGDGYEVLRQVMAAPERALDALLASQLTGLGGAHFPFARKLQLARSEPGPRVVVCNAAEDEPGSQKDRTLLWRNPHLVIEGALIAARALDADDVYLYLSETLSPAIEAVERALDEISSLDEVTSGIKVHLHLAPPEYVAGEASAVVNAINGNVAKPLLQPPFPTESGVGGRPTLVANCETLANLPREVRRALGGEHSVGPLTRLVTLTGDVADPGVYEVDPRVTTFGDLITMAGGVAGSGELKAIQPGGPSGAFLDSSAGDTLVTNEAITAAGAQPGCLAVRIFSSSRCLVEAVHEITGFFAREQCGQCPACRMKTQTYHRVVAQIANHNGGWDLFDRLRAVEEFVSDMPTRCALINMPGPPLESARRLFAADFARHIDGHACTGELASTTAAPSIPAEEAS